MKQKVNLRNLEGFRTNKYLIPYLSLQRYGPEKAIEMSYTLYAIHAFYSTMEDIKDLEQQSTFVNNGRRSNVSIALWFLALESFVNCIGKIVCLRNSQDFTKDWSGKSIARRLGFLLDTFPVEGEVLRKSGVIARVNEFLQFRNEIFHDRNVGDDIVFHKTNFSSRPYFNNQVDVFQALVIFIEICCGLRYVINGLDIMPEISIGNHDLLIFDKLDKLYNSFLKPFFIEALAKHNLTTTLDLNIDDYFQPSQYSNIYFGMGEILPVFQYQQNSDYTHPLSQEKTTIGAALYAEVIAAYGKPPGHYDSMHFIIDWPKMYGDAQNERKNNIL
ncbi:hypothetical protein [Mucilaginibacter lappiensis]|uniref:hypothetical protein n=1 Tax=Mucilaginibacter lappiensis TaxID=354630 RepID=UPI003D194374